MQHNPAIFVSFVVHATNAHELQEFLQFAEYDLRINVIMIRPLSELGVDSGAVEDLREIVPYECQVQDALEASNEYLNDISRRRIPNTPNYCDIRIDPATFRSVRPDPVDRIIMPPGFEGFLLAPRRSGWRSSSDKVQVDWSLNQATIFCPNDEAIGVVWQSISTPVMPDCEILFKANIQLNDGSFRIDIKNDEGKLLASSQIDASLEMQSIELKIQTGSATRVFFEVGNLGLGFSGRIDFIRLLTPGAGIRKEFKLPFPRRWQVDTPGVKARWIGNILDISAAENLSGKYLIKSYSSPCSPNNLIKAPLHIEVKSGTLVIGVLSEDFQRWTHQFAFKAGSHKFNLEVNTENNSRLQIVIFPRGGDPLNAVIDWGDLLEVAPDRELGLVEQVIDVPEIELVSSERQSSNQSDAVKRSEITSQQKTPKVKKIKFYCQKPWTDVNNFTVDGRMDVCCITTGSSQDHYSLGNILDQDFQEIWNGAQMKQFRKTVNSNEPLPPCQRCPMAYSYQGPFFDRGLAEATLKQALILNMQKRNFLLRSFASISYIVLIRLNTLFFRGFKK
jgi:radical SAM protein with 4Fe4S-binding SPASM domain